ncbi:WD-40 repeat-containing protein, putative [Eimeria maxima]|uniref:WD-40 repeat-containing protein, putative n=1 Tax=Eimeria maxima TaxID=5804 RepID=U6M5Z5_EIMMA|nr:WD-40 repeat-containing protein, putative [Eimeria maxima]CDJ59627.1 WD-40 repeat-containing protein, putative [Eimeria maxima]
MLYSGSPAFGPAQAGSLKVCWSCHVGVPCGDPVGGAAAAATTTTTAGATATATASWRAVSADFAADGSLLLLAAVGGVDGTSGKLLVVDLKTACVSRVYDCPEGGVSCALFVALSTAECLIGGAEADACVRQWDLNSNTLVCAYPLPAPLIGCDGLTAHPRQRLFLASCSNGMVLLFDLKQTQPLACMHCSNPRPAIAFDFEGLVFAVARSSTHVHLVNSELTDLQEFSAFDLSDSLGPGTSIVMARLSGASGGNAPCVVNCCPTFSVNSLLLFWSRGNFITVFKVPSPADTNAKKQQQQQQDEQQGGQLEEADLLVARHRGHAEPVVIVKASPAHSLLLTVAGGVVALWQPMSQV